MYRLVPTLVDRDGRGVPRTPPRPAADRGDAANRRRRAFRVRPSTTVSTSSARRLAGARGPATRCPGAGNRIPSSTTPIGFPVRPDRGRAPRTAGHRRRPRRLRYAAMAEQRRAARAAWTGSGAERIGRRCGSTSSTRIGRDRVHRLCRPPPDRDRSSRWSSDGARVDYARRPAESVAIVTNQTPFYGESRAGRSAMTPERLPR